MVTLIEISKALNDMKARTILLIKNRKLNQTKVSNQITPTMTVPNMMSKFLRDGYNMTLEKAIVLAEVLDVSLDYLLSGIGSDQKISALYSLDLSSDEKALLAAFEEMRIREKSRVLHRLKELVPANTFCSLRFLDFDFEERPNELHKHFTFFGQKLKATIKELGYTQNEVAQATGIDSSLISRYVKNERFIPTEKFLILCDFLKLNPSDLLYFNCEPQQIPGFDKDASNLIVYYRMLYFKDKEKILAMANCKFNTYY